ncbi:MAG: hypothetical protein N2438_05035 [Limisphaera sp.]|nr:hypothetical protein [Limisphaera sp.]
METFRILRISLLLVTIFIAGVLSGRWTAPRPPILVPVAGGGVRTVDMALARMTAELGLDTEQQAKFKPVLEEMAEQLAVLPPRSRQRFEVLQQNSPRLRAILRPEQRVAYDRLLRQAERAVERKPANGRSSGVSQEPR